MKTEQSRRTWGVRSFGNRKPVYPGVAGQPVVLVKFSRSSIASSVPSADRAKGEMMNKILVSIVAGILFVLAAATAAVADVKANRITIQQVLPEDSDLLTIHKDLKERRTLQKLQKFLSPFKLPRPLKIKLAGCDGRSDAVYGDDTITICYEYIADLLEDRPSKKTVEGIEPADTVIGPFFDTVLHEFAHALFDMLKIPVLGNEEIAADQLSAYIMLQLGKSEARRLIMGTAYAFLARAIDDKGPTSIKEFAETHGTDAQRGYNVLCIAYGADSQLFADVVEKGYLPKKRAERCAEQYEQFQDATELLISPHVDQDLADEILDRTWLPKIEKR